MTVTWTQDPPETTGWYWLREYNYNLKKFSRHTQLVWVFEKTANCYPGLYYESVLWVCDMPVKQTSGKNMHYWQKVQVPEFPAELERDSSK